MDDPENLLVKVDSLDEVESPFIAKYLRENDYSKIVDLEDKDNEELKVVLFCYETSLYDDYIEIDEKYADYRGQTSKYISQRMD